VGILLKIVPAAARTTKIFMEQEIPTLKHTNDRLPPSVGLNTDAPQKAAQNSRLEMPHTPNMRALSAGFAVIQRRKP